MKKILIALDYDPTAQKIAETGYELGKAMKAEIVLLHVISDPVYYSTSLMFPITGYNSYVDTGQMELDTIGNLKKVAAHFLEKTKLYLNDEHIKTFVGDGDTSETILSTAKELQANIIVMGSHSRKWLESILMGSVTENVFHHTVIPIFIVPTKKHS